MEQDLFQSGALKSDMAGIEGSNAAIDNEYTLEQFMSSQVGSQLNKLILSLKEVINLQKIAMEAQIDAREKRREAGFKRRDVWTRDATFMKELQRLIAKDQLKGFSELSQLAGDCQVARNELGPLEEQGTQAEQRLEGEIWKLQRAEEKMNESLQNEIRAVEDISTRSDSDSSQNTSDSESDFENESSESIGNEQTGVSVFEAPMSNVPFLSSINHELSQEILLSGIYEHTFESDKAGKEASNWDSDSGFGDIDQPLDTWTKNDFIGTRRPLPLPYLRSIDRYPELSIDFTTRREQINKWLLETLLLSHHEVNILMDQLKNEENPVPSNWSQLVIAYWELDEMAVPSNKPAHATRQNPHLSANHSSERRASTPSLNLSGKDIHLEHKFPTFKDENRPGSLIPLSTAPDAPLRESHSYVNVPSEDLLEAYEPP